MSRKLQIPAMHIRWLIPKDLDRVLHIEAESDTIPWNKDQFLKCLRQRNCIGMVIEPIKAKRCNACGYMIYELRKGRLHVIKLAVSPKYRRHGIGTQMVDKLKSKLVCNFRTSVSMELSERNLGGQLFLRAMGFKCVNVKRHWCDVTGDDGYVMEYRL